MRIVFEVGGGYLLFLILLFRKMRATCGRGLEEFNENTCSVALYRCGHVFDALWQVALFSSL